MTPLPKLLSAATQAKNLYLDINDQGLVSDRQITTTKNLCDHSRKSPRLNDTDAEPTKKQNKKNKSDNAGSSWAHMEAPELTTELKRELKVLQMRGSIDPKRFYRASATREIPKYFQVGTIVEGAAERKLSKKEKNRTMFGELLSDDAIRARARSKFRQVQQSTMSGVRKTHRPVKNKQRKRSSR